MDTENHDQAGPEPASKTDWVRYRPTGVQGVTLMRAHFTDYTFERHSHPEFGIGLTYRGVQTFNCQGSRQVSAPGNVIFLNPDQAHDGLPGIAVCQPFGHGRGNLQGVRLEFGCGKE